jgi:hypothetical protein
MSAGKGSAPRNLGPKFRENWDAIFRKSERDAEISAEIRRIRAEKPLTQSTTRTVPPHP